MNISQPIIQANSIAKSYRRGKIRVEALRGISFSLIPGEFMMITGESGSGKSTLLNLCGALDVPDKGELRLFGHNVCTLNDGERAKLRKRQIGFIFQDFHLIPVLTAIENVVYALELRKFNAPYKQARALLEQVELDDKANARANELSGGQMQRVAIARALAGSPQLIVADEPTANLDSDNKARVMMLLKNLCHQLKVAVMLVTHDLSLADWADKVMRMRDGMELNSE